MKKILLLLIVVVCVFSVCACNNGKAVENDTTIAYINAENMNDEEIEKLQEEVNEGHYSWRLDYEQVVKEFLSNKDIDVENGKITELAGGGSAGGISLTYFVGEKEYSQQYSLELYQPIDTTDKGIWIVRTFQDTTVDFFDNIRSMAEKELLLLSEDNIEFKLNAEISTIDKEPISEKEGRGDGFRWKDYSYEDISVRALIGDDNLTQIIHISTTSKNYKTPRDIKVGDTLQKLKEKYPEDLTTDGICYEYMLKGIGINRIYFYIENDIITKIVIENGIDA